MQDERKNRKRGDMRFVIAIHQLAPVISPSGTQTDEYIVFLPAVYAAVQDVSGGELFNDGNFSGTQTTLFKVNFREDIKQDMLIVYRNEQYRIQNIERADNRRRLWITAERLR